MLEIQPLLTLLCEEEMGSFVHKPLINGKDTISLSGVRSLIEIGKKVKLETSFARFLLGNFLLSDKGPDKLSCPDAPRCLTALQKFFW